MATTWNISIDWNRDGDYGDSHEDVTARVISVMWGLGIQEVYQDIADNSVLKLTLKNEDRLFSPDNSTSPLVGLTVPQRPIRIQSNDGTTTRTHWLGWIESIEPEISKAGKRTVEIIAAGAMQFLKAAETKLALQQGRRTDQIIAELIKEVVLPPGLNKAWILGRTGNSEVGTTMFIADTTAYSELDEGKMVLSVAADNWGIDGGMSNAKKNTFDVYRAIGDITAAEHGRFFFSRDGKAVFWNRHRLLQGGSPVATFDDTMTEMSYMHAGLDHLKNEVTVVCHPRTVSALADQVLWDLGDGAITVPPGKTRELYVKFEDSAGRRIGGLNVYFDGVVYEQGNATMTLEATANGAELKLVNTGTEDAIITGLKLKGRSVMDNSQMEATAKDSGSIIDYGRRTMRLNLPSIDNLEQAQYIADFERNRRSKAKGMVQSLTVKSHGKLGGQHHIQQLALTIGSLIRVKETQTGHDANYYVIGEAHELSHGATLWKTTWHLEPAPTAAELPWQLGVSGRTELGTATRLAY
ncbi:MAG: hypothetical protein SF123_17050 [Chloroflexota bacterium]|nr:hypothetical protein [Chloroflexota bacterium]